MGKNQYLPAAMLPSSLCLKRALVTTCLLGGETSTAALSMEDSALLSSSDKTMSDLLERSRGLVMREESLWLPNLAIALEAYIGSRLNVTEQSP